MRCRTRLGWDHTRGTSSLCDPTHGTSVTGLHTQGPITGLHTRGPIDRTLAEVHE